jgi:glycosyltransferase involved in cell wall biosynthesis
MPASKPESPPPREVSELSAAAAGAESVRKILFYIYSLGGGGAERVIALLASGFARRGVEVILAVEVEAQENAAFLDPAVRVVTLGSSHPRALLGLARLIARERPDISLSALGVRNLKHALAATLVGRRRHALLSFHGHYNAEPHLLDRVANRLAPLTTRLAARSVCVSAWMRRHVVEDLHGSAKRIVVIHNPVRIGGAKPAASAAELEGRGPIILALGRLVPEKDFALLIRAFASLHRTDARLIIIGEGVLRRELADLAQGLGVADCVEMPGYAKEPWAYFERARVCAVSSRSESFSNVVVEAMAHGLPVVSTDCGGPGEIISRPEEGVLVPVGDEAALAAALATVLDHSGDPAPRVKRADAFSVEHALDAYAALFAEVIAADTA